MDEATFLKYLTDSDGTTRDITFTPSPVHNVDKFMEIIVNDFLAGELFDQDGERVELDSKKIIGYIRERESGCIHGQLTSHSSFVNHIHLFIDWPEDANIAIEISYFPHDLIVGFSTSIFLATINRWWESLGCSDVFVRYENASWEFYNSNDLGVFYHATKT